MTPAELFQVETLGDYVWPVSYRFHLSAPWGLTQQQMTVDAPGVEGSFEASLKLGLELWHRAVAPATSVHVSVTSYDVVQWKLGPIAFPNPVLLAKGLLNRPAARREDTPCVIFHTQHNDDLARRRFFLAGAPAAWVQDGLLTLGGRDAVEGWSAVIIMGLLRQLTGAPMQLLNVYPDLLPATLENPSGVAFRKVEVIRGYHYTARAPEPSSGPWPS